MSGKASPTAGVKPMSIAGRYTTERERLLGMTDAERAFRKQWLKDQILSENEPVKVPQLYKATHNPIRRLYRLPLDIVQKALEPALGPKRALVYRYFTGKFFLTVAGLYYATYYFKYNANDWTRKGGWRVNQSRSAVVEGDPGYPCPSGRTKGSEYGTRGFEKVNMKL